jgi:multidrug efflux pump
LDRVTAFYLGVLRRLLRWPATTLVATYGLLAAVIAAYLLFGRGVEFFPEIEPRFVQVTVKARDNLFVYEKDRWVREVGDAILGVGGIRHIYSRTIDQGAGGLQAEQTSSGASRSTGKARPRFGVDIATLAKPFSF